MLALPIKHSAPRRTLRVRPLRMGSGNIHPRWPVEMLAVFVPETVNWL
jgi:hypothetical protein